MKVRNGFVSNSSSASFVVKKDYYPDISSVAKVMICLREFDDDVKLCNKIDYLVKKKVITPDTPLSFSTINYDTFIVKDKGYFLISTCNNHWNFSKIPFFEINASVEVKKLFGYDDLEAIDLRSNDFYFLESGLYGKISYDWHLISDAKKGKHDSCFSGYVKTPFGKSVCLSCQKIIGEKSHEQRSFD